MIYAKRQLKRLQDSDHPVYQAIAITPAIVAVIVLAVVDALVWTWRRVAVERVVRAVEVQNVE